MRSPMLRFASTSGDCATSEEAASVALAFVFVFAFAFAFVAFAVALGGGTASATTFAAAPPLLPLGPCRGCMSCGGTSSARRSGDSASAKHVERV